MDRLETLLFGYLSLLLQWLAGLSGRWVAAIVAGLLVFSYGMGHLLQRRLARHLRTRPDKEAPLGRLEAVFSLIGPLALLYFFAERMFKGLVAWLRRRKQGGKKEKQQATAPTAPVRVATLGPTFFFAGLLTGGIYWLAWLTEPLFANAFGVSPGHSYWQYLLLGQRPEFAWLLPLEDQPWLAILLCLVFLLVLWWSLGNVLRGVVYRSTLRKNHGNVSPREVESVLPVWSSGFGVVDLIKPSESYRRWAPWMAAAAIVLVALAGMNLGGKDGDVAPSALALALVVTLSWVLHLRLEGEETSRGPSSEAGKEDKALPPGWPQVEEELRQLYGYRTAETWFELPVPPLDLSVSARKVSMLSPLVDELLSDSKQGPGTTEEPLLTPMQSKVLETLSLLGYVHLPPPTDDEELRLVRTGAQEVENRSGHAERHQVVLAPEGSGKTTLAMLAAANHVLVHARATLVVTCSEAQAEEATSRIHSAVEPSTMRWNLRVRRIGRDFASDLSRDIIPDVVVVSLDQLVTSLLDDHEVYTPFLRQVGLVVVDDVESFAGAVEIHAQLAFRRLRLLFRQLGGVEQLGEENEPLMLVLGVDTMKQTATWAQNLCGIQASVRLFPAEAVPGSAAGSDELPVRVGYRLGDLRASSGRPLTVAEVVTACEARGVPWHYRPAGDGRRQLGRGPLLLGHEPDYACPSARGACVVFLEGRWSEVRRELRRLSRAGCDSGRSEIAILAVVEAEEAAACEVLDPAFGFASEDTREKVPDLTEQLATLPIPILRPPSTLAVQSHLLSDLLQEWIEVKDLVDTFGAPVARSLRSLRNQGMLYTEERRDVKPELKEYEPKVYVRALATSLRAEAPEDQNEGIVEFSLYDKVRQVELVSPRAVRVCNRSDQNVLRRVEADSAGVVYYPGRVFEDSRGRFVVVGRIREGQQVSDIEVEPALYSDLSSPRRRYRIVRDPSISTPYPLCEPELVLLGRDPVEIGLVGVRSTMLSVATYRLDRSSGEVQSRELHEGRTIQELFASTPLETVALVLIPNPKKSPSHAPPLRFGEARLLSMLLRYVLPLVYRDTRDQVEVALSIADRKKGGGTGPEPAAPAWDDPLGPEEALYILDLHQGGSGLARAVYTDGLSLLLRFCRHFLETVDDFRRLLRLYDHWGNLDEILADGRPDMDEAAGDHQEGEEGAEAEKELEEDSPEELTQAGDDSPDVPESESGEEEEDAGETRTGQRFSEPLPWAQIRQGLLEWLDSRLHSEVLVKAVRGADEPEESEEAA